MKIAGIILIIAGFALFILKGIDYTKKEKVVEVGPLEISKKEHKTLTWPYYTGAIAIVAGIILILGDRKRK